MTAEPAKKLPRPAGVVHRVRATTYGASCAPRRTEPVLGAVIDPLPRDVQQQRVLGAVMYAERPGFHGSRRVLPYVRS
jgi:hypothetical protein